MFWSITGVKKLREIHFEYNISDIDFENINKK